MLAVFGISEKIARIGVRQRSEKPYIRIIYFRSQPLVKRVGRTPSRLKRQSVKLSPILDVSASDITKRAYDLSFFRRKSSRRSVINDVFECRGAYIVKTVALGYLVVFAERLGNGYSHHFKQRRPLIGSKFDGYRVITVFFKHLHTFCKQNGLRVRFDANEYPVIRRGH